MSNLMDSYCLGFEGHYEPHTENRLVHGNESSRGTAMGQLSILDWYGILRAHYQWPMFQAIRYALWLAR
jgi:hypothetical protein